MNTWLNPERPLSIAHRGASAYAAPNSLQAFEFAAALGADMIEVDLHLTRDGHVVVTHDATLSGGEAIADLTLVELHNRVSPRDVPTLASVLDLAQVHDLGIYADIKAANAANPTCELLQQYGVQRAILGAFDPAIISVLEQANPGYPRAQLVPMGVDPFEIAATAEIIHLCWEAMEDPVAPLNDAFFARCRREGKQVVLWHEEDKERMARLRNLPVLGICSDMPELVNPFEPPFDWPVQIVCHRGANSVAPENTLAAARACYAAGFSHVEIDVHATSDGELVVLHDPTLERTTDGVGRVNDAALADLRALSAGAWFSDHHAAEKIPTLDDVLALAKLWHGKLYVELKTAPAAQVWERVCAFGLQEVCFFWSFDHSLLEDMRAVSDKAHLMMRRQDFASLEETLGSLNPSLVEFTTQDDLSGVAQLKGSGVCSMIAYNGNNPEVFRQIAQLRPDLVNLHQPFEFVRVIQAGDSVNGA